MNYLGSPARNEVCSGSERKENSASLSAARLCGSLSLLFWRPGDEDKGPGPLETPGRGLGAWRPLESPGGMCLAGLLYLCGERGSPSQPAPALARPAAWPSAVSPPARSCCLCPQDPSRWGAKHAEWGRVVGGDKLGGSAGLVTIYKNDLSESLALFYPRETLSEP